MIAHLAGASVSYGHISSLYDSNENTSCYAQSAHVILLKGYKLMFLVLYFGVDGLHILSFLIWLGF